MIDTDISGENIVQFTGKRKEPVGDLMLVPVPVEKCRHIFTQYEVDIDAGKCKCLKCGAEVSPIFVLEQLMHQESRWMRTREAYLDEMKRLDERARTKCQHCGEMTRISRR
jgi:hypothetical protein